MLPAEDYSWATSRDSFFTMLAKLAISDASVLAIPVVSKEVDWVGALVPEGAAGVGGLGNGLDTGGR